MKAKRFRLLILCPFGVYPPRSGGHRAILENARFLARSGLEVDLYSYGLRRFEALRHFRSFRRVIAPGLTEYRYVSPWVWVDFLRRGRKGLPPLYAAEYIKRSADRALRHLTALSDFTICESPWFFPLRPPESPVMFIAHNVEVDLADHNTRVGPSARRKMNEIERTAWQESDAVVCLTEEDRKRLVELYGKRPSLVIPVGVDSERMKPVPPVQREEIRRRLGVEGKFVVLFTGSWHPPNRQALSRIMGWAKEGKDSKTLWVVAGSVGSKSQSRSGLIQTGPLPDLSDWFHAADCAVNPMLEGSGMNVKMLHYFSYGLPVVTTPFGARGLGIRDGVDALIVPPHEFLATVNELMRNPSLRARISENARRLVETAYSWNVVGQRRWDLILSFLERKSPDALSPAPRTSG